MSATTAFSTIAKALIPETASLEYYNSKTLKELKVLAMIHNVPDAGEPRGIVARLMASDKKNDTWPGKHEISDKKDGKGSSVAPTKQVLQMTETPSETKTTAAGKPNNASTATVSTNNTATTSMIIMTAMGSAKDTPIPMLQLAKEWNGIWGPPFAFTKVATVDSKSRGTSVTTAGSTPTRLKSPVSPASPVSTASPVSPASPISLASSTSSASAKSNRYNVLLAEEKEISEPVKRAIEVVKKEISAADKVMKEAPSVQEEWASTWRLTLEEDEEEKAVLAALANDKVDVGEQTTKKKKRGKKGGKMVNKANTDAVQSTETETETDMMEAATSDATAALEHTKYIPVPVSSAKFKPTEAHVESTVDISGPVHVVEEDNCAIVESSPSVAPTEVKESIDEQIDLGESKPIAAKDTQESPSPSEIPAPEQPADSPPTAAPSTQTVKPAKKPRVQTFPVAPPLSLPFAQTATATAPTKTKNQRRNDKRKENRQTTSSNMFNVLVPDQSPEAPTLDSSDKKENEDEDNGEGTAPATKKNKRGAKGGKKVQAKKKNQPTPIAETAAAAVAALDFHAAAVAAKIDPMHVAFLVAVAVLAGALGAWVKG